MDVSITKSKMPGGYPGGGMLKFRIDQYIMLNKGKNQCVKIVHKGNNSDILMYATCLFLERHVFVYKLSLKE